MQDVPVAVAEELQPVALIVDWFAQKLHAALLEFPHRFIELIDADGQMPDSRVLHLLRRASAFRRYDLQHRTVRRPHEIVAVVGVVDAEIKLLHIPFGKLRRIGRRNSSVLQTSEHTEDCSRVEATASYPSNCAGLGINCLHDQAGQAPYLRKNLSCTKNWSPPIRRSNGRALRCRTHH